jgi:hypothetical protein
MELEFVALELAGIEADWLRKFLFDIPLGVKPIPSISIYYDSQAAIHIIKNKVQRKELTHEIET